VADKFPIMESSEVHRPTRKKLCKIVTISVLGYENETRKLSQTREKMLNAFESKFLSKIFGPVNS